LNLDGASGAAADAAGAAEEASSSTLAPNGAFFGIRGTNRVLFCAGASGTVADTAAAAVASKSEVISNVASDGDSSDGCCVGLFDVGRKIDFCLDGGGASGTVADAAGGCFVALFVDSGRQNRVCLDGGGASWTVADATDVVAASIVTIPPSAGGVVVGFCGFLRQRAAHMNSKRLTKPLHCGRLPNCKFGAVAILDGGGRYG